jgi:hypothetical protein
MACAIRDIWEEATLLQLPTMLLRVLLFGWEFVVCVSVIVR